ncbi:Amidase [Acidimicrobium ferrooxidans DSM 10331]|uniref:Amidase n=1 Tax=Acidimicrobium ferrooxidans (strain DSM 10331 / JCM 15462 / NBRC 103882 / ICP) TaxID=525909 RepID=C7M2F7_ACIFD|nr:amidase [Acidimicrobium ferrooxidans]ACU53201.1 Amidase [Acidimicrobium ferrooxidans DSM 10331]
MSTIDLAAYVDGVSLAAALRRREVGVLEVLQATLELIDERNPALGAIVWLDRDDARRRAERAARRLDADDPAPFLGVPLPVKDLHPVAGWPITYGSWGGPEGVSARSSIAVEALEEAGFVLVGRSATPELGELPATEGDRYGVTRNPWDLSRTPGGSSGGAAAAVAGGMVTVAHGSDGGGSLRIPAAACGLVGLKPSRGRVPARSAPWFGLSTEGVVTRSIRDQAACLAVLAAPRRGAWLPQPPAGFGDGGWHVAPTRLRVGVVTEPPFGLPIDDARRLAVGEVARLVADLGHEVREVTLALPDELIEAVSVVVGAGVAEHDDLDWSRVEPHTAAEYERAKALPATELVRQLMVLERTGSDLAAALPGDVDVLLTPTTAIAPPPVGTVLEAAHAAAHTGLPALEVVSLAIFTLPWNIAGLPAISLPTHLDVDGLPIGVQLVGPPAGEATLLALGAALEEVYEWTTRRPPVQR